MNNPNINSNRLSTPTPATNRSSSAPSTPTEAPGMDQAAAEFASMLGADSKSETETQRSDSSDFTDRTRDGESARTEHERVEERREDGGDSDGGDSEGDEEPGAEVFALGDLILQSMSRKEGASAAAGAEGPMVMGDMQLDNIVQQVADRILVSPPGSGGSEVRIMLKDSVLQGTEIRITQFAGQLQISLVTDSARSAELLAQHQAALQQRLGEKLTEHEVVVNVEMSGEGQPDQDGRSRNQRDIIEETKEKPA